MTISHLIIAFGKNVRQLFHGQLLLIKQRLLLLLLLQLPLLSSENGAKGIVHVDGVHVKVEQPVAAIAVAVGAIAIKGARSL